MQQPQQQPPPATPLRRRTPSEATAASMHTPSRSSTPNASPARATRSHDKTAAAMHSAASASAAATSTGEEESPASNQENQALDTNANVQQTSQHTNDKQSAVAHSAHVPSIAAASAVPVTPKSVSRKKKQARVIVPDFLGPATPSKNVEALPFHVAAAAAAAADQAAQQRLMLQQFSNGSNLGAGLSLEEEFNMVASTSGGGLSTLSAAEDLSLLSNPPLSAFHSPQRPLAYTPLRTPLHPVTAFTNNAHAAAASSASVASNAAASTSAMVPAPAAAAPSLRSKQKLRFVAPTAASGAAAAAAAAPFKIALPDTYLKVLAGATNAFASSYPSAARAAARASASASAAAAAASSALATPPAASSSSILSPSAAAAAASSTSTWSNFNFSLHSFASTTSQPNQSEACSQLFASSSSSAAPSWAAAATAAVSESEPARPLDEAQLKELVQQSLEQAGIESDVDGAEDDEEEEDEDAPMHDVSAAAPGLFGAPLPYAPESFTGSMVRVARKNRVPRAPFLTPERTATQAAAAAAAPAAPASEPQLSAAQLSASPAVSAVPAAPNSAPVAPSKRARAPKIAPVFVPGFPVPVTTKRGLTILARQLAAADRPPKPESLRVKRRKTPQFVNKAVQLVVDVHQAREKTDTLEAGMGLEMLTHGIISPSPTPSAVTPSPPSPTAAGDIAASLYPMGFRSRAGPTASSDSPGYFTAAQRTELRCQVQLHMQLLYQTHWLCAMLPNPPPAKQNAREGKSLPPTPHAALAQTTRALIEQMVDVAQGTTTASVAPAAAAAATAADPASSLSVDTSAQVAGDADEHAERLMLLMNASTASPKSSASGSDDATDDDEPSSKPAAPPAIRLASVGPYARTTPMSLPAFSQQGPLKVLQVPAMSLWPHEDCLRNLAFPEGADVEQRKMEAIEAALESEKMKPLKMAAAAMGDKDEAMQDSATDAKAIAASSTLATPAAGSASSSPAAALSTPSAKGKRSTAASAAASALASSESPSDSKQPRYLQMLPQSLVQSFWTPLLQREAPESADAAASAAGSSAAAAASAPNCYGLDHKFFVRYLRHERHTFSTAEDHLWKLGLVSGCWTNLKAKFMARKDCQQILAAAVQASNAAYNNPNSGRRNDPNRRKLHALLTAEEATVSMLSLIRRRFLPGKTLEQLQTKLLMQFMNEKKAASLQPRMLIMPQGKPTEAAIKAAAKSAALTEATCLPRAFRPMPSQIAAAVEQGAEPLAGFVILRDEADGALEHAGAATAAGAAAIPASSPFAPVLTLRDLTPTELLVVTKGLELHGSHRNKWSLISTQMLPYFPRKLLAKAWTKHQARLTGAKTKAAATPAADSTGSEVAQKKPRAGGRKRKGTADEGAVFDTMDLSAAPAQATPAERRRIEEGASNADSPEDEFDTMEISMHAEEQAEEAAVSIASRPAAALLSPQQPAVNQAAIKVPVGFTPAKPDQSSNQLAA